jgi:hypothetical protein
MESKRSVYRRPNDKIHPNGVPHDHLPTRHLNRRHLSHPPLRHSTQSAYQHTQENRSGGTPPIAQLTQFLFAVALTSVVCACIRLSQGLNHGTKLGVAIWAVVEASTALSVACAPALRPLIFRTSYFVRDSLATPQRSVNTARRPASRKSASQSRLNENFDLGPGVHVTKSVQVTTHVPPVPPVSSGSSVESYWEAKKSRRSGSVRGDPNAMGFQAEVISGDEFETYNEKEIT